jgi:hypothetical protein
MKFFKKINIIALIGAILLSFNLIAQDFSKISTAMQVGNATELAKHFDGNVEVTILKTSSNYSKSQAEMIVKNFFNSNQPRGYKAIHNGSSGGGAQYQIGELACTGKTYRTYIFGKPKGNVFLIQEIRIEEN